MRLGCHSLIFGALSAEAAVAEVGRAGFETVVLAEIEGQARHASQLARLPLMPLAALDVAAHERNRVQSALIHAVRLGISTTLVTSGGRPGSARPFTRQLGGPEERSVPRMLAITPRAGSAVWNAESALHLIERAPGTRLWPDTSHLARAGDDLLRAADSLAPYSVGWFIRDHDGTAAGPGSFESQVPGRGTLPVPEVVCALVDAGFSGPIVFHAVGHLPAGRPRAGYPLERLRVLAREARDYLVRYCTSSADRPT